MLAFLATLLLLAASVASSHPVTVQRGAVPVHGWSINELAAGNERVRFHLALPQRNLDVLDGKFWAVSNPDSDEYGQFMTVDEIQSLVSPPLAERSELIERLVEAGVEAASIRDYGDSMEVDTTVDIASSLFDTTFHVFQHQETARRLVRASSDVSVSLDMAKRIEAVYGLTGFPVPHFSTHARVIGDDPTIENDAIIPQSLYAMYGLPRNTTVDNSHSSGITQGVIEWEGETFSPQDLLWFATNTSLNGAPVYPDSQIVGNDPLAPGGGESTLDVDMIVGVAPGNSNWFWLEDNQTTWLFGFTVHFLNATAVPDVISVSYGWYEGGQCDDGIGSAECAMLNVTSADYVKRVNTQWQKIGLRGVSTFISSGDSGCHTRADGGCQAPTLLADYPSSSPYITSVGATQVQNDTFFPTTVAPVCREREEGNFSCISGGTEVAVDVVRSFFTSGGGFSNISMSMTYQRSAVAAYLKQTEVPLPPADMFNQKGRAYPDVSAVGHNGYILQSGGEVLEGGTSQSSPIFAGVAALLNVQYKKITGNALGFMNPLLYKMWGDNPAAFNDVTMGDNICTEDGCSPTCKGFLAATGWDPVTGLGTPNYPTMLAYVEDMGHSVVARRAAKAQKQSTRVAVETA